MRVCLCCGGPIALKNKYGYCSQTPECRSRYQQAWQDARRPPDTPPAQPCKSCGIPTTAKSGYCKRSKTCDAARARAEYTPEKHFAKYKPEETRRHCLDCGKYLDLRLPTYVSLCTSCQGTAEAQRKRWRKARVMQAYGGVCACCGESNLAFLTIDHVNGDGAADRRELDRKGNTLYAWLAARGFPERDRFQVLCFNCNCAKSTNNECPCKNGKFSASDVLLPGQLSLF